MIYQFGCLFKSVIDRIIFPFIILIYNTGADALPTVVTKFMIPMIVIILALSGNV